MTHILHRAANAVPPVAVSGDGVEIVDAEGRRYLDASGGAAVSCLGHAHPDVVAALHKQLDALAYAHTAFFTSEPAERLADRLIADAPPGVSHVYLTSGGSEAVEAALKMARQYFVETGEPQRRRIVARRQSYHGATLGALASGGNARRAQFEPLMIETWHVDPCYAYRYRLSGESDADYAARAAEAIEAKFIELGPETVIAFVAETVVGATLGAASQDGQHQPPVRGRGVGPCVAKENGIPLPFPAMAASVLRRSRVDRASRSRRVTISTSPASSPMTAAERRHSLPSISSRNGM